MLIEGVQEDIRDACLNLGMSFKEIDEYLADPNTDREELMILLTGHSKNKWGIRQLMTPLYHLYTEMRQANINILGLMENDTTKTVQNTASYEDFTSNTLEDRFIQPKKIQRKSTSKMREALNARERNKY